MTSLCKATSSRFFKHIVDTSRKLIRTFATTPNSLSSYAKMIKSRDECMNLIQADEQQRNDMVYSLSHTYKGDFKNPLFKSLLNDRMLKQLDNTHHDFHEKPLPRRLKEARSLNDSRAIVITEATVPFRIISVNASWERLCGYSQEECEGNTLGLIHGPETDKSAISALMAQVLKGEQAGTLLTNYNKEGRKFYNRLRVGPLENDYGEITHFVGVLKEVNENGEFFAGSVAHA